MSRAWTVWGVVARWIDGDTVVVKLDLGWGIWHFGKRGEGHHVRLLDVDTPERGEPGYAEAKAKAEAAFPPGSRVQVTSRSIDSFGRILGHVSA